jgi:hypothetical protein
MDATQPAKAIYGYAYTFEIRQLDTTVVPHHHMLDVTTTIDQRPNLSPGLV